MSRSFERVVLAGLLLLALLAESGCFSIVASRPRAEDGPAPAPAPAAPASMRRVAIHPYGDRIDPHIWTDGASTARDRAIPLDSQTYVRLAQQVNPAVVSIFTTQQYTAGIGDPLGIFRIPFRDLYARSLGSGFVIHPDGFIVTNAHVVAEADEISVLFQQEEEIHPARVVGLDTLTDVALLKIDARRPLPVLPLADSNGVLVGDVAVAIGNPYGLQHSLTVGVISATGRRISESSMKGGLENYLQTSAQINPGNSGGPLVNLRGEAIGVNTAVVAQAQGIGFAVPSSMVKQLLPTLVRDGRITRSFVGLLFTGGFTPFARTETGEPETGEVVVWGVYRGSPAAFAGVRRGDRVVSINGDRINDPFEAGRKIAELPVGSDVTLRLRRAGGEFTVRMRTIELSD